MKMPAARGLFVEEDLRMQANLLRKLINVGDGCALSRKIPDFAQKSTLAPAYVPPVLDKNLTCDQHLGKVNIDDIVEETVPNGPVLKTDCLCVDGAQSDSIAVDNNADSVKEIDALSGVVIEEERRVVDSQSPKPVVERDESPKEHLTPTNEIERWLDSFMPLDSIVPRVHLHGSVSGGMSLSGSRKRKSHSDDAFVSATPSTGCLGFSPMSEDATLESLSVTPTRKEREGRENSALDLSAPTTFITANKSVINDKSDDGGNVMNANCVNAVVQSLLNVHSFGADLTSNTNKGHQSDALNSALLNLEELGACGPELNNELLREVISAVEKGSSSADCRNDPCEFMVSLFRGKQKEHDGFVECAKEERTSKLVYDIVKNSFGFTLRNNTKCQSCGDTTEQDTESLWLPLQVSQQSSSQSKVSLDVVLRSALHNATVNHQCHKCHSDDAIIQRVFIHLPKCLIVVLQRIEGTARDRRYEAVDIPLSIRLEIPQDSNDLIDSDIPINPSLVASVELADKKVIHRSIEEKMCSDANGKGVGDVIFHAPALSFRRTAMSTLGLKRARRWQRSHFASIPRADKKLHILSRPKQTFDVFGDGNCLFRCISYLLTGGDEEQHAIIRSKVCEFESKHSAYFEALTEVSLDEHLSKLSKDGEWGTSTELFAIATILQTDVWTFFNGKWLPYRPRFTLGFDGTIQEIAIRSHISNLSNALFLLNKHHHFNPVTDIQENVDEEEEMEYRLVSVLSEDGTCAQNGYSVADIRSRESQRWSHCEAGHVTPIEPTSMLNSCSINARILFYEPREQEPCAVGGEFKRALK